MQRFRSMTTLQKFSSVHAQVHNYFQSGTPSRHKASLQAETLGRVGRLARTRGVDRRLRAGMSRHTQTTAVNLTKPPDLIAESFTKMKAFHQRAASPVPSRIVARR